MLADTKEQLFKNQFNKRCFDCNIDNPDWISVNNSVFLCKECQLKHRSYGVSVSLIRSIELDKWKDEQIAIVRLGGNERLKDLMLTYNIKSNIDKYLLYNSKLLDYYRKLLKAELRGDVRPKPPSDEEALEIIDNKKLLDKEERNPEKEINNEINKNIEIKQDDNTDSSYLSSVGNYAKSVFGWGMNMGSLIGNKINESGIKEKITEKTNRVSGVLSESIHTYIQKGAEIGHTLTDKGTQIGKNIVEKGAVIANTTIEYTKNKYEEVKENGIKTTASKIYVSATDNISNYITSFQKDGEGKKDSSVQEAGNEMEAKEEILEDIKSTKDKNEN